MSYYQFNRQEILHKAKEVYSKEKAAEYYAQNKEAIKKKEKKLIQKLVTKKGTKLKSIKRKDINNWFNRKRKHYKINKCCFFSV